MPRKCAATLFSVVFVRFFCRSNTFAWREVGTGGLVDGRLEIVRGLAADETFVAEGAFLLKSELLKKSLEVE